VRAGIMAAPVAVRAIQATKPGMVRVVSLASGTIRVAYEGARQPFTAVP
jgi:hypothetical protein